MLTAQEKWKTTSSIYWPVSQWAVATVGVLCGARVPPHTVDADLPVARRCHD
jgi:hypothetical protein